MDRGAWQATVHGVAKSHIWLSNTHTQKYSYNHWTILNSSYLNICIYFFTPYLNILTTLSFSLCIARLLECFFILLLTFWGGNFLATVQKGVEFFCFSVAQTVQYCLTNASKIWRCSWLLIAWYKCPGEMEGHWPYRCPFSSSACSEHCLLDELFLLLKYDELEPVSFQQSA